LSIIEEIQEPLVLGTIIVPDCYLGDMVSLSMVSHRGSYQVIMSHCNWQHIVNTSISLDRVRSSW